jgi:hypothetical protein
MVSEIMILDAIISDGKKGLDAMYDRRKAQIRLSTRLHVGRSHALQPDSTGVEEDHL